MNITVEATKTSHLTGRTTKFWDVKRDGQTVAQLSKHSAPFSKYCVLAGDVYRNDFSNKEAAISFAAAL